jgi:hypothetical protein
MSTYLTPILVYGFNIGDQEFMIDYCCLENKFPFVRGYTDCVENNNLYEAIYGIECDIDQQTAQIDICDEHRYEVRNLLDEYINYLRKTYNNTDFLEKKNKISLCFRMAIDGNYNTNKKKIILEYSDDDDEYEDEEDEDEEKY